MPRRNLPTRHDAARRGRSQHGAGRQGDGTNDETGSAAGRLGEQAQSWRGQEFRVRAVSGSAQGAQRPYRCPGCDQLLPAGIAHVVVWPADDLDASDRRHWHAACWNARDRRAPGVQRSRNAPRYG